jgi:hypothetical protein
MKVGDTVVRRRLPHTPLSHSDLSKAMRGEVVKVTSLKLAGGVTSKVTVRWENQWSSEGRHDNRMLQVV